MKLLMRYNGLGDIRKGPRTYDICTKYYFFVIKPLFYIRIMKFNTTKNLSYNCYTSKMSTLKTYKCIQCNKIITKSNKINHEKTKFHINNSKEYKTCISCNTNQEKNNFYNEKINVRIV